MKELHNLWNETKELYPNEVEFFYDNYNGLKLRSIGLSDRLIKKLWDPWLGKEHAGIYCINLDTRKVQVWDGQKWIITEEDNE